MLKRAAILLVSTAVLFCIVLANTSLANDSTRRDADFLHLAVATNFLSTARSLAREFEKESGYRPVLSSGSTGKLYAQIVNGAPYDIYLAADSLRPLQLEKAGLIVPASRYTYAIGRLALWSRTENYVRPGKLPEAGSFTHFAIANPRLAPYGRAAQQTLQAMGAWQTVQAKLVLGESIGQTFLFVASGNAQLGLIAVSQLPANQGSAWLIPAELHQPIEQQAVLLSARPAGQAFMNFLRSPAARKLIREHGYDLHGYDINGD
jgi:molybdate transport system substrate-binding protein